MSNPFWPLVHTARDPFGDLRAAVTGEISQMDAGSGHAGSGMVGAECHEVRHDHEVAPVAVCVEDLACIATEHHPDAGDALWRVIGPWARDCSTRDVRLAALAHLAFAPARNRPQPSVGVQLRRPPRPSPHITSALRLTARCPTGVWRVHRVADDEIQVEDMVGLHPSWVPVGAIRLGDHATVGGPLLRGAALCGRMLPTVEGWVALTCLTVPICPPVGQIREWVTHGRWEHQRMEPAPSLEGYLRLHGEMVVRRVHEWWWHRAS